MIIIIGNGRICILPYCRQDFLLCMLHEKTEMININV
jgi:hypothetical protein